MFLIRHLFKILKMINFIYFTLNMNTVKKKKKIIFILCLIIKKILNLKFMKLVNMNNLNLHKK